MTDRHPQEHVQNALDWEPSVDAADIGVSVEGSVVTLRGDVKTYAEKAAAERVALGVYGVKAVANDINVQPRDGQQRTDSEIAQAVLSALKWNTLVPEERITVTVSDGFVTLKGKVDWEYQRKAAGNVSSRPDGSAWGREHDLCSSPMSAPRTSSRRSRPRSSGARKSTHAESMWRLPTARSPSRAMCIRGSSGTKPGTRRGRRRSQGSRRPDCGRSVAARAIPTDVTGDLTIRRELLPGWEITVPAGRHRGR